MIIEQHALWGDEATDEHPATYVAYVADALPAQPDALRPAMVVCPGGGFTSLAAHEKEPVALAYLNAGYQVFVLSYVTSATGDVSYPHPEFDLARLIATIRRNAAAWRVDPDRIFATGFSAGGFVCAALAAGWRHGPFAAGASARPEEIRPTAVVLGYPLLDLRVVRDDRARDPRIDLRVPKTGGKTGRDLLNDYLAMVAGDEATEERLEAVAPVSHVSRDSAPMFIWGSADDTTCPIIEVYDLAAALARAGVTHEVHVFDCGRHGLSVANINTRVDNADVQAAVAPWFVCAIAFLDRVGSA